MDKLDHKMDKYFFIKIRTNHGRHTDVYVDFEEQLKTTTGWQPIKSANKYFQFGYSPFTKKASSKTKSKFL